jgi:hypothetical protein
MDYLEKLVKLAGLLAVFGYISLRAHVNRLGIPFTSSLTVEGYLRETYSVLGSLLDAMLVISIVALAFLFVSTIIVIASRWAAPLWSKRTAARIKRALGWLEVTAWSPSVLLVLVLSFYLWLMRQVSQYLTANAIAVGQLDLTKLNFRDDGTPYLLLVCVCIAGYALHRSATSNRNSSLAVSNAGREAAPVSLRDPLWRVFGIFLIALALHIPLIDGVSRRDSVYTQATIFAAPAGASPVCGLVVLTTDSMVEVWQTNSGAGVVQMIPTAKIERIVAGAPADLMALARMAALNRSTVSPPCIEGDRAGTQRGGSAEIKQ